MSQITCTTENWISPILFIEYDSTVILGIAALVTTISGACYIVRQKLRIDLSIDHPEEP